MAAIRARIKMVGPRQLYRLGSDGAVGMRVYATTNEGEEMERKKKIQQTNKKKKKKAARAVVYRHCFGCPCASCIFTYTTPKWPTRRTSS